MWGAVTRRTLDFVYAVARADNLDEFRTVITFGIGSVVGADLASYTEVEVDGRRVVALVDQPIPDPEGIPAALGRLAHQHPLITRSVDDAQTISDYLSRARFHSLELYADVYGPLEAEDQIAINLRVRPGTVAGVAMNRARRNFTAGDRATLTMLRPVLMKAYRRARARDRARAMLQALTDRGGDAPVALLALDERGHIEFASDLAPPLLQSYFGRSHGSAVPERLLEWLQGTARQGSAKLTVAGQRGDLSIRSLPTEAGECSLLEMRERSWQPALPALTPREGQVLEMVARGLINKEIAGELRISRSTVENHLASIYRKLGVSNRTAAVARTRAAKPAPALGNEP